MIESSEAFGRLIEDIKAADPNPYYLTENKCQFFDYRNLSKYSEMELFTHKNNFQSTKTTLKRLEKSLNNI